METEALTLSLLSKELFVIEGEVFIGADPTEQVNILNRGLEACAQCAQISSIINDIVCEGAYLTRLGNGLYTAARWDEAEDTFRRALSLWYVAAQKESQTFLPKAAKTLGHLAGVLDMKHKTRDALSAYRESIDMFRKLPGQQLELARSLNDCAAIHHFRNELVKARGMCEEACQLYRNCLSQDAANFSTPEAVSLHFEYSRVLASLAQCLASLKDFEAAEEKFQEATRIQQSLLQVVPNLFVLQLAKSRNGLGTTLYAHWESDDMHSNFDNQHSMLLREARQQFEEANEIYRRYLPWDDTAYLEARSDNFLRLGTVLASLGETDESRQILMSAERLCEANRLWVKRAYSFEALRFLETRVTGDPSSGFDNALAAVEVIEEGMSALGVSEREHRDLFKGQIEQCYLTCLAEYARLGDEERTFHFLEAVRRIDRLSLPSRDQVTHDELTLAIAREIVCQHRIAFLAVQVVPGGVVFFSISPSGSVQISCLPMGWRAQFQELFESINLEIRVFDRYSERTVLFEERCTKLFDMLPESVQKLFASEPRYLFLSAGGYIQHLPFEFLRMRSGQWCGLTSVCPRVHSFEELRTVLGRQPAPESRIGMVAGDPEADLPFARRAAVTVGGLLTQHNFQLAPTGGPLLGDDATHWKVLDGLDSRISAGLFIGHGEYGKDGALLRLGLNEECIRPSHIQHLRFDYNPILHYECCDAGMTVYHKGGYQEGFAVASLAIGASACLVANRLLFEEAGASMTELFYSALLTPGVTAGEALLQARSEIAKSEASPLFWALPAFYGNPDARLEVA
jgi:tetratricopeptide (TPR) repeat protein